MGERGEERDDYAHDGRRLFLLSCGRFRGEGRTSGKPQCPLLPVAFSSSSGNRPAAGESNSGTTRVDWRRSPASACSFFIKGTAREEGGGGRGERCAPHAGSSVKVSPAREGRRGKKRGLVAAWPPDRLVSRLALLRPGEERGKQARWIAASDIGGGRKKRKEKRKEGIPWTWLTMRPRCPTTGFCPTSGLGRGKGKNRKRGGESPCPAVWPRRWLTRLFLSFFLLSCKAWRGEGERERKKKGRGRGKGSVVLLPWPGPWVPPRRAPPFASLFAIPGRRLRGKEKKGKTKEPPCWPTGGTTSLSSPPPPKGKASLATERFVCRCTTTTLFCPRCHNDDIRKERKKRRGEKEKDQKAYSRRYSRRWDRSLCSVSGGH